MSSMQSNSEISDLQEILRLQQGLQDITDCINAAQNVKQIILDSRPLILKLFNVEAAHIYVVNSKNKTEIYTYVLAGDQVKERKTEVSNQTIPGYVANTGRMINISDFSNNLQINKYSDLLLDSNTDSRFGVQVKHILAMPVVYGGEVLGAIEVINKKGKEEQFSDDEPVLLQEMQ